MISVATRLYNGRATHAFDIVCSSGTLSHPDRGDGSTREAYQKRPYLPARRDELFCPVGKYIPNAILTPWNRANTPEKPKNRFRRRRRCDAMHKACRHTDRVGLKLLDGRPSTASEAISAVLAPEDCSTEEDGGAVARASSGNSSSNNC